MMDNIFWFDNNYKILIENNDFIPKTYMSMGRKLNAITRTVIILSIFGFFASKNIKFLFFGIITVIFIILSYKFSDKNKENYINVTTAKDNNNNSFLGSQNKNSVPLKKILKNKYYKNNKKNPFGNVLLPEINENPNRKSAPPSFNLDVEKNNTDNVKKTIQYLNPDIIDTNTQLFGDLWQNFELDQSNRAFYSNANSRICNDQTAFGNFLYGNMPSAKEGNQFALLQDNYRYTLY